MGTESTGQPQQGQAPQGGWGGALRNTASGTIGRIMDTWREEDALRKLDEQRQREGRRAQNIRIAEQNRNARVAREVPGQPTPPVVKDQRPRTGPVKSPWGVA